MTKDELSREEAELINLLRNYRSAYPNGAKWMKEEIKHLTLILQDPSYRLNQEN